MPRLRLPASADERPLAWLFSRAHLGEAELMEAGRRVREGERAEPGRHLLSLARKALGQAPQDESRPLSSVAQLLLGLGCVLFTPLLGLAVWYGLKPTRPRAAWAAMRATLPGALAFLGLWIVLFTR